MSNEYDYDEDQAGDDVAAEMEAFEEMAAHFGQTFSEE